MSQRTRPRHVVGVMTGTSIDGLDAAVMRIDGRGLAMQCELLGHQATPLGALAGRLREVADQAARPASTFARLAWDTGGVHAEAIAALCATMRVDPDFIAIHGQTIFHRPPHSWQLVNPWPIVAKMRCPVVHDLRQADLVAGGEGAPISPIADWILFRSADRRRAIVNLGGFCNVTVLPPGLAPGCAPSDEAPLQVRGADICSCNHVLDRVARTALGRPFDTDGEAARRGTADVARAGRLADRMRTDAGATRRSLGTADEAHDAARELLTGLNGDDQAATAVTAVAHRIADALAAFDLDEIILAGGGARNLALVDALTKSLHAPVLAGDALGMPPEAREAAAMAVLGALCADGIAITSPAVTGRAEAAPIAGAWCGGFPARD